MKHENYEYHISSHYVCPIFYGDYSGLDDHEIKAIEAFLEQNTSFAKNHGGYISHHWTVNNDVDYSEDYALCYISNEFARIIKIIMVVMYE